MLFLDELPEFRRDSLEALASALEDGEVTVVRSRARFRFPARFALVAAMAPCPCGHRSDPRHECRCSPQLVERYHSRVRRPLLKRIDLHVEVPALSASDLKRPPGESSAAVAERVLAARSIQHRRFGDESPAATNAGMTSVDLERFCRLEPDARSLLVLTYGDLSH